MSTDVARLLVLACALACVTLPGSALAWEVRHLDVRITVLPDARIRVVEAIHADFGSERERGITRTIPLTLADAAGYRTTIEVRLIAVTDAEGVRLPSRVTRTDRDLRIWIGARDTFVTGEQLVLLTYEAAGAILGGPTRDELYWQVTGHQWDVPILEAQALVELPPGVDLERLEASSVVGRFGDPGRPADMRALDASRARFVVRRGLVPREGFLVSVVWPSGLVQHPGPVHRAVRRLTGSAAVLLPVPLLLVLLGVWLWRRRLRRAPRPGAPRPGAPSAAIAPGSPNPPGSSGPPRSPGPPGSHPA